MSPHDLVDSTVRRHEDRLLRVARRYTDCADDAHDAYQRALEIFVRNAGRLDPEKAHHWLSVVVRNEALAVRRQRAELVGCDDAEVFDLLEDGRHLASLEERTEAGDDVARAAEALRGLKPHEATALWLQAHGLSYAEIAERQGWSYTKVNRLVTEGRRAFLRRFAGIESGAECARWAPALSALADGEATAPQLADLRGHLRNCAACRASLVAIRRSQPQVAAAAPVAASGGLLSALAGWVQERATVLHGVAESASASKAAAVVASTAALAGGGVAVERHARERPTPPPVEPVVADQRPVPAAVTTVPDPGGAALPRVARAPATQPKRARKDDPPDPAPDASFAPELRRAPRTAPPPPLSATPTRPPAPAPATGPFGFEGD